MSRAPDPQDGDAPGVPGPAAPLDALERDLLDFEREWWRFAGAKDVAIRDRFAMNAADYYRALGRTIDRDAALEHDPLLVRRLRRQRLVRRRERSARRIERG